MAWDFQEALDYYKAQGAQRDQNALISLLKEVQAECGGAVSQEAVKRIAGEYGLKESLILALIRRIPSLRLKDRHEMQICCGPNCPKRADVAELIKKYCPEKLGKLEIKLVGCMRNCAKGPNIKLDGELFSEINSENIKEILSKI